MTIVACWLDESYGVSSLAAMADARASEKIGATWFIHSENTIKLFSIDVRCFLSDALTPGLGARTAPYHETTIGLGFAGHCFEALTTVAHIQRAMGGLSSVEGQQLKPSSHGLTNLAREIAERYLRDHSFGSKRDLELLLFGWEDATEPWIAKLVWNKRTKSMATTIIKPAKSDLVTIGDGPTASSSFPEAARLRRKIATRVGLYRAAVPSERTRYPGRS